MNKFYNQEIEYGVLGSLIKEPKKIFTTNKYINHLDFYYTNNQRIYQFIEKCVLNSKKVDALDIHNKLDIDLEFLTNVLLSHSISCDIISGCEIIKEKSIIRQCRLAAAEITKIVNNYNSNDSDISSLLSECKQAVNIQINQKKDKTLTEIGIEVLEDLEKQYNKKDNFDKLKKDYYGINFLDKYTGGTTGGELTILGARPSVGKTALALQIMFNKCMNGARAALFCLEMKDKLLLKRLLTHHFCKSLYNLNAKDWENIGNYLSDITETDMFIFDRYRYIESIILKVKELHYDEPLDFVIIDYLQLLKSKERTFSENHFVSILSRQLKELAIELNIPILCLSQLNRNVESRQESEPGLYDLRSSGSLEQDADNVFFLYELKEKQIGKNKKLGISIAKQREGIKQIKSVLSYKGDTYTFGGVEE